eukprot:TRINITY_DN16604_c0_g1_i1.p1 TRINITY_DN16604_c0_g1~~TRINITY_DN16604_c0_g1_i1.p1  ORF type:complete len:177 (+),score=15.73 TRINITY_DN16604_c0_g1_i1:3-533(+)
MFDMSALAWTILVPENDFPHTAIVVLPHRPSEDIVVGRAISADCCLSSPRVSRHHCTLSYQLHVSSSVVGDEVLSPWRLVNKSDVSPATVTHAPDVLSVMQGVARKDNAAAGEIITHCSRIQIGPVVFVAFLVPLPSWPPCTTTKPEAASLMPVDAAPSSEPAALSSESPDRKSVV